MTERQRAVELKAGAFVLATLVVFGLGVLWVIGSLPVGQTTGQYTVLMGTAAGVRSGDRVRVSGIEMGRVENIALHPGERWPVVFQISLDDSILVTEESSASITSDGLLSSNYLQIDPGPATAPPLPAGGAIYGSAGPGLMAVMGDLGGLSQQASKLLEDLGSLTSELSKNFGPLSLRLELLLSDQNLESFASTLTALRTLAEDTPPLARSTLEHLDNLIMQLSAGAEDLPQITASLGSLLADLHAIVGTDGERLTSLLESTQRTLDSAGATLEVTAQNRHILELTLRDLQETMENLRGFTATLERRPTALLRKERQPDRKPGEGSQ